MKDQTYRGTYTPGNTHRGDIRLKEQSYGGPYTRRGYLMGGDIHMKEQTYGETYIWWITQGGVYT